MTDAKQIQKAKVKNQNGKSRSKNPLEETLNPTT
jgi:hypothetical protein